MAAPMQSIELPAMTAMQRLALANDRLTELKAEAIESRGQYQSHHIIEYNHGCESSDDSSVAEEEQYLEAQANAYLISELRNVAPAMLEVLGGFQVGDAHALTEITALLEEVANISPGDRDLLHRMQAMAAKMGGSK